MKWTFLQQFSIRLVAAVKFLWLAHLLGPEQLGQVVLALALVAILENVSDVGFSNAIIQYPDEPGSRLLGRIFALQTTRGIAIFGILSICGIAADSIQFWTGSGPIILLSSCLPLIRGLTSVKYSLVQRSGQFRTIARIELASALLDLIVSMLLLQIGLGAASAILGYIAGDVLKVISSWLLAGPKIELTLDHVKAGSILTFGLWTWLTNLAISIQLQFDKLFVSIAFGSHELGLYQTAMRVAQLIFNDLAVAVALYVLPKVAHAKRHREDPTSMFLKGVVGYGVYGVAALLVVLGTWYLLPKQYIGGQWLGVQHYLLLAIAPALLGGFVTLFVAYFRGIGEPAVVLRATFYQLIVFIAVALALTPIVKTSESMIYTCFCSALICLAILVTQYRKRGKLAV